MKFDLDALAAIYGFRAADIAEKAGLDPASVNWNYEEARPEWIENFIIETRHLIETKFSQRSTAENQQVFEAGWGENLKLCREQGVSAASLRPLYARPWKQVRYANTVVLPENPHVFEDLVHVSAALSFRRYFAEVESVYEFGCGTARFLYLLGTLMPEKALWGADWTPSTLEIIDLIARSGRNIQGHLFDMLQPDLAFSIDKGAGVYTVGALEQLGNRFGPFLDYLLSQNPAIVVHHEPILEFYDEKAPLDRLAMDYHLKRGYLNGYLTALRRLETEGKIRILQALRPGYGDGYNETASLVVWKPA